MIPITHVVNSLIHSGVKRWYLFQLYSPLKAYKTVLLWESTDANSLTTSSLSRPSKNVKSVIKRDNADWWSWVNVPLFISTTCTTAAPTGRKRGTLQTERGICELPFIVASVASRYKDVHEWRHGLYLGSVEGVDAAVVTADVGSQIL